MLGQMMHRDLSIIDILKFASENHSLSEVVSLRTEGDMHRYNYTDCLSRVCKLANALVGLGIKKGDRVATLAWNGYRHLELYYGISGIGAVCHTINPRLSPEQMLYIIEHAGDRLLFVDTTFVPIIEKLIPKLPKNLVIIVMASSDDSSTLSDNFLNYEQLILESSHDIIWPELPENTAAGLCYTSGTTGNPKGALYSHRSTVLHALTTSLNLGPSLGDGMKVLPVVPLFHVNAWGLPYAAPLTGTSLIFPGPNLDGASLFDLMDQENVNSAWGVPTVWLGLLEEIRKQERVPSQFQNVVIGGSAAPKSMIEEFESLGITVCHAWGMTEMSPVGTQGFLPGSMKKALSQDEQISKKCYQGRRVFGVDLKIVDENDNSLPHDGIASGELYVRGNAIISGYYKNNEATEEAFDKEGWFGTGDIASITTDGFLNIQDRAKDLIKSGGEWISSIDIENIVMGHPKVANCAVIAVPHPKWEERPLLVIVSNGDTRVTKKEIDELLLTHIAKWQLPDAIEFLDALPLTATGKVSKLTLRKKFSNYKLN
ncbi:MAG: fatty-acid--CoA ligase [Rhodobacterales bacterium]|jgi:fatty-acyl-CoA synthase|nr:fatty-acid--CoA ligase [Rhodobacterales bacterium]